jgi:hypothetical protein
MAWCFIFSNDLIPIPIDGDYNPISNEPEPIHFSLAVLEYLEYKDFEVDQAVSVSH